MTDVIYCNEIDIEKRSVEGQYLLTQAINKYSMPHYKVIYSSIYWYVYSFFLKPYLQQTFSQISYWSVASNDRIWKFQIRLIWLGNPWKRKSKTKDSITISNSSRTILVLLKWSSKQLWKLKKMDVNRHERPPPLKTNAIFGIQKSCFLPSMWRFSVVKL